MNKHLATFIMALIHIILCTLLSGPLTPFETIAIYLLCAIYTEGLSK